MNYRATSWAMRLRCVATTAKLLLLLLAKHLEPGSVKRQITQRRLASECEIDVRTVVRSIKVLEARGNIKSTTTLRAGRDCKLIRPIS